MEFGFQILFVLSAFVAAAMAICVHKVIPESLVKAPGRIDVGGALLLGGGLAGVLRLRRSGRGPRLAHRRPAGSPRRGRRGTGQVVPGLESKVRPLIDVRSLDGPLVLMLLVVFLGSRFVPEHAPAHPSHR
ncbi:hypothetical protein LV779_12320 [Streptomyces thinghirensis]|nr:hypothetical protein [Streptomyces thinghirensis]